MISVIVPAHNEEPVIGRCLDGLIADAAPDELDVIVVANGCTDRTAIVASTRGARVVELDVGLKSAALNAGDRIAVGFPRFYVDADVELDTQALRRLAAALDEPGVLAVAPAIELDTSESSWPVRAYHRIWVQLPSIRDGLAGRGAYGMNQPGRSRFESFPELVADDSFVHGLFEPDERRSVATARSVVRAPHTVGDLLSRMERSVAGLRELSDSGYRSAQSNTAWIGVVRRQPARLFDAVPYVLITLVAKWRGRRARRRGVTTWSRDDSTRR